MRRHLSRPLRWVLVALAFSALLADCTVGPQDQPVPVEVPHVTRRATTPISATGVPLTMQAYLLRGDRLVRVERIVPAGKGIEPALSALALPLSRDEVAQGLRTALPITTSPMRGRLTESGVALIGVPQGFDRLSVREQAAALGQIVFTVTADTLATGVQLVQGNRVLAVPDPTGELLTRPLTRNDYVALTPGAR